MKKTLFATNAFGQVNIWGSEKYGYTIQLVKPEDRNLVSDKEYLSAARRFLCVQKFYNQDTFKQELEKFMGLGVYGMFTIEKHQDKSFTLKAKRYIPDEVKAKYRAQKQAEARNNAPALQAGFSQAFV